MRNGLYSVLAGSALAFALVFPGQATGQAAPPLAVQEVFHPNTPKPGVLGTPLRLDDVVRLAFEKSPAILAARYSALAESRKEPQARAFPDPSVGIGWMGNIQPFSVQVGDPASYRSITAMQTLPYPGKRKLRGEIAGKEAEAAQTEVEGVRRRLLADLKAAYFDYWYYERALQANQKNKDLLTKLSQIAAARYQVGKGLQQDVLKSQVELSLLLQRRTLLEQQRATAQARLNALMGNDPETPLPPAAEVEPAPLRYSLDELYQAARQSDPEMLRAQRMAERNELAVNLAQKELLPDLSVGYMYQQRPDLPDMHGMTFSVSLPVFSRTRQHAAVQQATEERISAEHSRTARQNQLYFELKEQYLAAKAGDQLLKLYAQGVVPQSSLALESSLSAYQVGSADFLNVLGTFNTLLNYETDYYREVANYQTALARLEALAGTGLTDAEPAGTSVHATPENR